MNPIDFWIALAIGLAVLNYLITRFDTEDYPYDDDSFQEPAMILYFAEQGDLRLKVTFDYNPGTPDVMYLSNGDPGYPGDPPELNIESVFIERRLDRGIWNNTGIDLLGWLWDDDDETPLSKLSAAAIEAWEDERIKQQADYYDAQDYA